MRLLQLIVLLVACLLICVEATTTIAAKTGKKGLHARKAKTRAAAAADSSPLQTLFAENAGIFKRTLADPRRLDSSRQPPTLMIFDLGTGAPIGNGVETCTDLTEPNCGCMDTNAMTDQDLPFPYKETATKQYITHDPIQGTVYGCSYDQPESASQCPNLPWGGCVVPASVSQSAVYNYDSITCGMVGGTLCGLGPNANLPPGVIYNNVNSCDEAPGEGCISMHTNPNTHEFYSNMFTPLEPTTEPLDWSHTLCASAGFEGYWCSAQHMSGEIGCVDPKASNYKQSATIAETNLAGLSTCTYDSCGATPGEGCYNFRFGAVLVNDFLVDSKFSETDCEGEPELNYPKGLWCEAVPGCTDSTASNYNADANEDDGSCLANCMDSTASNFNPAATQDDGSCKWTQTVNLPAGWSIFSTYLTGFADPDFADLLTDACGGNCDSNIHNDILLAKNKDGAGWIPIWNFNGIGGIVEGEAYEIKTTKPLEIEFTGVKITDSPTLKNGWNLVGHLSDKNQQNVAEVFAQFGSGVRVVDTHGNVYLPEYNINNIGDMQPGLGYWVRTSSDYVGSMVLDWPADASPAECSGTMNTGSETGTAANSIVNTGYNTHFVLDTAVLQTLGATAMRAYCKNLDANGNLEPTASLLVGEVAVAGPVVVMTVWGDDTDTDEKDGCTNMEAVTFRWVDDQGESRSVIVYTGSEYETRTLKTLNTVSGNSVMTLGCTKSGCTDSTAFNYNPDATVDDGSCMPVVHGCTDPYAANFDATANTDDGSCFACASSVWNDAAALAKRHAELQVKRVDAACAGSE